MSRGEWTSIEGWPVPHPPALEAAIRSIAASDLPDTAVQSFAHLLSVAESDGWAADSPHGRSKSVTQNEVALISMRDMCAKLGAHIDGLPREAFGALFREGLDVAGLRDRLSEAHETVRRAFNCMSAPEAVTGRPLDQRARLVADEASAVYAAVTGVAPTFTTNPLANTVPRRIGPWPDFLRQVFDALMIDASTDSHVERIAKKK